MTRFVLSFYESLYIQLFISEKTTHFQRRLFLFIKPEAYHESAVYLCHNVGRYLTYPVFESALVESAYLFKKNDRIFLEPVLFRTEF